MLVASDTVEFQTEFVPPQGGGKEMNMNLKIGTTIKSLRAKHKVTQDQLATFLGCTPQAISRWESETSYPDIELLPSIAAFFSVSTDELLGLKLSEREQRRAEIYDTIARCCEMGADGEEDIRTARSFAAEFPSVSDSKDGRIELDEDVVFPERVGTHVNDWVTLCEPREQTRDFILIHVDILCIVRVLGQLLPVAMEPLAAKSDVEQVFG